MPKEACKLHNLRTPHFSANKSEMASIPNDNPMKNSRHYMKAQPMPTSLINTEHNWPSTKKTKVNGAIQVQQQTIIWKVSQNVFGTSHWWILPRNNSLWDKHVNISDAHTHTHTTKPKCCSTMTYQLWCEKFYTWSNFILKKEQLHYHFIVKISLSSQQRFRILLSHRKHDLSCFTTNNQGRIINKCQKYKSDWWIVLF